MSLLDTASLSPHDDVNAIVMRLARAIDEIVGDHLVALYLTGSLTYGDFDRGSSDIDYLAVLNRPLGAVARASLAEAHERIAADYPEWAERIEGSYVLRSMLGSVEPPEQPRPYVNGGAFWNPDPHFGNEWLINLYAVRGCGIALIGPSPEQVIPPVAIADVREASRRDLLEEWVPKIDDTEFLGNSHYQAYLTLTLCRILHRAQNDQIVSKRVAAAWVRERYPEPWLLDLVDRAERWQHGKKLGDPQPVRDLIAFTRDRLAE
jgi:hypothetical protein